MHLIGKLLLIHIQSVLNNISLIYIPVCAALIDPLMIAEQTASIRRLPMLVHCWITVAVISLYPLLFPFM